MCTSLGYWYAPTRPWELDQLLLPPPCCRQVTATFPLTSWAARMMARRRAAFLEISRSVNWSPPYISLETSSVNELCQF